MNELIVPQENYNIWEEIGLAWGKFLSNKAIYDDNQIDGIDLFYNSVKGKNKLGPWKIGRILIQGKEKEKVNY